MEREKILKSILQRKAVAVLRIKEPEKLKKVIEAIAEGGITVAEITMTVPNAIELIERMSEELDENIIVGVGSVLNAETAEAAIKAGAKYVVSPVFKKEIIEKAHQMDVPAMPGCFTPTEIQTAYEAGADIIKVFPADVLGMKFFKGILAPMPHLKLMPTGGVNLTNAGEWLNAGACAVGIGSALLDKDAIKKENYSVLTENARLVVGSINEALNK
ncbi:2-dehydro-3-deoxyphosphogluconate aldolase/4- hydroxy-2-oxoglutarate aldolase [Melioribacter roseus P3M-2]|uniref:2-dehydro-3-deoxyphosphogluconate aldolase/4-hydroxy-2-oxoglutarate aldolase n=1 Tax=Melioribacter roseus (strain DSM 23840 / JCM 17771 / VKM B-2668 / P3M-2) TaxID=1191523 RepID=I6ZU71_MELRP|nr:bifunctional 4-hydroxy-2-oxoglutarate aldolase/2-dehydro-3-deoxy-phosphogluconate aldolase [Melioribacter roseus]AFN75559.1 2-dehydro-3-deoxyphosphogluconate aldolase/4- hydroxy-2-oxoglutarate aldolase [Melioribacter roseus P3M-2]